MYEIISLITIFVHLIDFRPEFPPKLYINSNIY